GRIVSSPRPRTTQSPGFVPRTQRNAPSYGGCAAEPGRNEFLRLVRCPLSLLGQLPLSWRGSNRPTRHAGPDLPAGPLQSRPRRQAGSRRTGSKAGLSLRARLRRTCVRPLQAGLPRRILPALHLSLGDDLAAEILRGMDLTHKALIAQRLLR